MPSTFECPNCHSRRNNWIASKATDSSTETTTYQCKDCLHLFDIDRPISDEDDCDDEGESQWDDNLGKWASNEGGSFDDSYWDLTQP